MPYKPSAEIPPEIPYVVLEVVSPDDRLDDILAKLDDYQAFGIPHIWLADPAHRRLSTYRDGSLTSRSGFCWSLKIISIQTNPDHEGGDLDFRRKTAKHMVGALADEPRP